MRARPTDLAQYELLHGSTEYPYDFPASPSIELHLDLYADRSVSVFLHVRKDSIDRWVNIISGQRRVDLRGRFANCVGLSIHCAKEATINALVVGNPVGVDKLDYSPTVMHTELPVQSEADKLRREFRALLDARLPQKRKKEIEIDPELMGDEIPNLAGAGFEIDDDDPLDPADGVLLADESVGDPRSDPDRTRANLNRRSGDGGETPPTDKPATAPQTPAGGSAGGTTAKVT